ncbi:hypothetical protein PACTADRAFT_4671 [Pachysolen tannophilus NRRL Y-2460]|uniref:Non-specific serine/threonine protein kinase n=1 Tax=Pachysolen tannophilus NRRL Y-2460 TaxID=669874 RepID=A0A1E4TQ16_PACTA|nr:hypothetical protein PACTADRAFT_4671 [Pachysolen tannophilus NRRL Y-2460]
MSVNTHLGREQSRRDDLEALGHVFFYFLRGQLPWQGLKAPTNKQKYEKIGEKKRTTPVLDLCAGLPKQFAVYLETVRGLAFDADPDYNSLRHLLLSVLEDIGESADGQYDWMRLNGGRGWDAAINKKPNLHGYGHPNPPGDRDRRHQQQRRSNRAQQSAPQQQQYLHHKQIRERPLPQLPQQQQQAQQQQQLAAQQSAAQQQQFSSASPQQQQSYQSQSQNLSVQAQLGDLQQQQNFHQQHQQAHLPQHQQSIPYISQHEAAIDGQPQFQQKQTKHEHDEEEDNKKTCFCF